MVACNKNQSGIYNEDLQGTYDADFSSLLKQLLNEDEDMKEDPFALAFAELLVSDMKMTLTFANDSLFTETNGSMVDFAQAFSGNKDDIRKAYQYEIRNDSILYTKEAGKDYEEFGILRRIDNKCDSIILVMKDGNIIEQGNHDELMKQKGFYHDLYQSQFLGKAI
jgi:hypothetical protein